MIFGSIIKLKVYLDQGKIFSRFTCIDSTCISSVFSSRIINEFQISFNKTINELTYYINKLMIRDSNMYNQLIFTSLDGSYKRIMKFIKYLIQYFLFFVSAMRTWKGQECSSKSTWCMHYAMHNKGNTL